MRAINAWGCWNSTSPTDPYLAFLAAVGGAVPGGDPLAAYANAMADSPNVDTMNRSLEAAGNIAGQSITDYLTKKAPELGE